MVFSSVTFLYVFFPMMLFVFFIAPKRARNAVLLIGSLLFYFWGEQRYTWLLLLSSLSDYAHALYIETHRDTHRAKAALVSAIILNILMLGVFKYADFLIGNINGIFGTAIPLPQLRLPIGISFYTFQTMSYTIDVYRGDARAQKNLVSLATYVCLFPQLIAGPIVRYVTIAGELEQRRHTLEGFSCGAWRFVVGLAKKVLLADQIGELSALLLKEANVSVIGLWVGTLAFMLQVYYDFSGYSDMAIGLGRMFGFTFPENFDYPFISKSLSEFWRRWHMTLGNWFRDYVYIPMGGNRVPALRQAWNLLVVWALTGLWHGAAWNFVLWGVYFAVMLTMEKMLLDRPLHRLPAFLRHLYTLFALTVSFAIFNADAGIGWVHVLKGMFGAGEIPVLATGAAYYLKSFAVVLCVGVLGATPAIRESAMWASRRYPRAVSLVQPIGCAALLLAVTAYLVDGSFQPFLYFRF